MSYGFFWHLRKEKVPAESLSLLTFLSGGGVLNLLLVILLFSGIALALFYEPSNPLSSVRLVVRVRPYGWFFWGMHYVASQILVVLLFWHMLFNGILRVSRYDVVRSWSYGVVLFILLYFEAICGYILRGDERAQLALTVLKSVSGVPFTTRILYVMHTTFLPLAMIVLFFAHLYSVRKSRLIRCSRMIPATKLFHAEVSCSFIIVALLNLFLSGASIDELFFSSGEAVWFLRGFQRLFVLFGDKRLVLLVVSAALGFLFVFPKWGRRAPWLSSMFLVGLILAFFSLCFY